MKIAPAAALAIWAIGTVWLIAYYILERLDSEIGAELSDMIQIGSFILGVASYFPIRKLFAAWLEKNRNA